ncbi:hypothetical protein ACQP3F_31675, partial [Escherichia coli]
PSDGLTRATDSIACASLPGNFLFKRSSLSLSTNSAQNKLTMMNISIFVQGQTEEMPKHSFFLSS